jgi:hypothetical protein
LPGDAKQAAADQRWQIPLGYALGTKLADRFQVVDYGFDPLAGDRTIELGQPPNAASRYDGVDTDSAKSAFGKLGFSNDGDFLSLGDEGEVVQDSIDKFGAGPIGINRVASDGDSLAFGAYEDDVSSSLGQAGVAASDTPGVSAIADCMGDDVFEALIVDPEDGASDSVTLVGYGLQASGQGKADVVPEVLCAAGDDGGSLSEVSTCMDSAFNDGGVDPTTQRAYEDILGHAEIENGELDGTPWVRATFQPPDSSERIGALLQMAQQQALAGPLGADAAAAAGANATPEQVQAVSKTGCAG